jgi:hypothetical protein
MSPSPWQHVITRPQPAAAAQRGRDRDPERQRHVGGSQERVQRDAGENAAGSMNVSALPLRPPELEVSYEITGQPR